jgi:hypothetical protein
MPIVYDPGEFLSVKKFVERYPNLGTEGSLRWQVFCAEENGLARAGAIVRRGRRLLICVPRYVGWLTDLDAGE